jgi:hypothetical protein
MVNPYEKEPGICPKRAYSIDKVASAYFTEERPGNHKRHNQQHQHHEDHEGIEAVNNPDRYKQVFHGTN